MEGGDIKTGKEAGNEVTQRSARKGGGREDEKEQGVKYELEEEKKKLWIYEAKKNYE